MKEKWVPVLGWEGFYEISDQGRLRSMRRPNRIMKTPAGHRGYPCFTMSCHKGKPGYRYRSCEVHRVMLESFTGKTYTKQERNAAHKNGVKTDNRLANLYWATPSENNWDRVKHGTMKIGNEHHNAKLNPEKVRAIRKALASGATLQSQSLEYGVAPETIDAVKRNKTWRHV